MLLEVRGAVAARERADGGDRFGAEQEDGARGPLRDRLRELGDEVLRGLATDDLEHRAPRVGADPLRDGARVVVRLAERRGEPGRRDLELPHPCNGVDGGRVDAGVGDRPPRRLGCEIDSAPPVVVGGVDRIADLADADEDGGAGIEIRLVGHLLLLMGSVIGSALRWTSMYIAVCCSAE